MAQFMVVLDVSIVNVALPQMRSSLGLTVSGEQWVINAYTLTFAGFLMLGGRAADLFGRRRVFIAGLSLFTVFSLVGGLAPSGGWLLAARAAQGLGGAILAPATLTLLMTSFVDHDQRRRALGAWSATAASGAAAGVLAGGILTDLLNWRWVLFVNVPIGVALLLAARWCLTESKVDQAGRDLDVAGAVTITVGLATIVYAIVGTDTHPWGSSNTLVALAIGVSWLVAFFVIEARVATNPLVPLSIFRRKTLSAANLFAVALGTTLFGMFFFMSLYLQQVNDYSPLRAGLAFLPQALATMAGALAASRVVARVGIRRQLVVAPLIAAAGLVWLAQLAPGSPYPSDILGPILLIGFGCGLCFVPMTLAATSGVPAHQAGLASGLLNTSRQLGGALGLAALATLATHVAAHGAARSADRLGALTSGYDDVFLACAAVLVAGSAVARLLPSRPTPAPEPEAAASDGADRPTLALSPSPGEEPAY
jgi:EmrB/QacA subfamily drug resistance transporter